MMVMLMSLFAAALVVRRRYFIVAPRPFPAAPFVVHRRCLIVVPRPLPPVPQTAAAGEEQHGRFAAEQSKFYRLY